MRRYFDCYGFHDGRIIKCARKLHRDDITGEERPVLVYRLKYNDGDQEDFLHHEIASLREVYDRCNISPEAPVEEQIIPGSLFETRGVGVMKILSHRETEEGKIMVTLLLDGSSKAVELDLLSLQKTVLRKFVPPPKDCDPLDSVSSSADFKPSKRAPVLEWPGRSSNQNDDESMEAEDDKYFDICGGLKLHRKRFNTSPGEENAITIPASNTVNNPCDIRPGCTPSMWDPAACYGHLSWDPYASTLCELCGVDKDDKQLVICDECHSGFHTYCLRPVMVNIPKGEWLW